MALGLLGLKVGMTQVYDDKGKMAPVTVLQVGPCPVLQVRDQDRDGYDAVQLGFLDKPRRKAIRAERGHVAGRPRVEAPKARDGRRRRAAAQGRTASRSATSASSASTSPADGRRSAPS